MGKEEMREGREDGRGDMREKDEGGRIDEECMVRGEVRKARDESVVRVRGEAKGERGGEHQGCRQGVLQGDKRDHSRSSGLRFVLEVSPVNLRHPLFPRCPSIILQRLSYSPPASVSQSVG